MHFFKSLAAISLSMSISSVGAIEIDETATIKDTKTTIMGINHIGLSVKNLDQALAFLPTGHGFRTCKKGKSICQ